MYKLRSFKKIACNTVNLKCSKCDKIKNNDVNIWKIPFLAEIQEFAGDIYAKLLCQDNFLVLYWISILLAIIGFCLSANELYEILTNKRSFLLRTFSNRNYQYFNPEYLRRSRICCIAINFKAYLSLVYGLLSFKGAYMQLWVYTNAFMIAAELVYLVYGVILAPKKKHLDDLLQISLMSVRWIIFDYIKLLVDRQAL